MLACMAYFAWRQRESQKYRHQAAVDLLRAVGAIDVAVPIARTSLIFAKDATPEAERDAQLEKLGPLQEALRELRAAQIQCEILIDGSEMFGCVDRLREKGVELLLATRHYYAHKLDGVAPPPDIRNIAFMGYTTVDVVGDEWKALINEIKRTWAAEII